jgi:acyl-CoA synthetase (AMP-forming)/AMP-acid ligase II
MEPRTLVEVAHRHLEGAFPRAQRGYFESSSRQVRWVPVVDLVREAFGFARRLRDALPDPRSVCVLHDLEPQALSTAILAAMAAGSTPLVVPRNALDRGTSGFTEWMGKTFAVPPLLVSESLHEQLALQASIDGSLASVTRDRCDDTPFPTGRLAFLQCTSATTGNSKVAMITHENVLQNVGDIRRGTDSGPDEIVCSWLPLYHDMGLVGCELFSLVHGYRHLSLRAYDFLRRPSTWLRLISQFQCTLSPAPNFGYQYAIDHVRDNELEGVRLDSWRIAFNGAEPVRVSTLRAFAQRFSRFGFDSTSFRPSYGLAEATLAVCVGSAARARYLVVARDTVKSGCAVGVRREGATFETADPVSPGRDELVVTSCGRPVSGVSLSIAVDGRDTTENGVVGEILVRGRSVFAGYLSSAEGPPAGEVRTGDVGFLYDGELYVVDRLKNIVIINGTNYPASDLEERVGDTLSLPSESIMVFERAIGDEAPEVVAVVESESDFGSITPEALQSLSGILAAIVFVKRRSLPKTTSGKKQHHLCRALLAAGELSVMRTVSMR